MRTKIVFSVFMVMALAVAGCSVPSSLAGSLQRGGIAAPSSSSASTPAPTSTLPTPSASVPSDASGAASATTPTTKPAPNALSPNDPAYQAIQSVIQRANEAQQQAFAKNDPTVMRDTATADYYNQMVQINGNMANGGVTAIKLLKIEWGPFTLNSPTSAEVTTFETWQSTNSDGSTDQSRDRNVYTLVQDQGTWKIQTDDQPDSGHGTMPSQTSTGPSGVTPPSLPAVPVQTGVSHNWSGYAASSGKYTGVAGTWTVPQTDSAGSLTSGATWVGIGGVRTNDLIQAGTDETSGHTGQTHYEAWIEMLPQASHPVRLTVAPGDSVSVSIDSQGNDQWLISMKNNTTGQKYQTTVQYASSMSSADWVVEAPSAGRRVLPLDNFGTLQFAGGSAIKDGKSVTIAQSGAKPITMLGPTGGAIATPSSLTTDGAGFTVSRTDASSTVASGSRGGRQPSRGGSFPGRFTNTGENATAPCGSLPSAQ